jgi:molybdate transport system substrate-binding protein
MGLFTVLAAGLAILTCARPAAPASEEVEIHVAAAANLTQVLPELAAVFERESHIHPGSHIHVIPSYGATAQLTQQAESGAPWDVFLSADTEHVDELVKKGLADAANSAVYSRGKLVVWAPKRPDLRSLDQLANPGVRFIVVAKPELAPYGEAAVETLKSAGLWDKTSAKIVCAPSIAIAKQFADTGNGDAAFTALALVVNPANPGAAGNYFPIPENLHKPIDQAMCVMKSSQHAKSAQAFFAFMKGASARAVLERYGYTQP